MHYFRKSCAFCLAIVFAILPFVAFATNTDLPDNPEDVTTVGYVDAKDAERIEKPNIASHGQILTYGPNATADSQPVAQYVKVPITQPSSGQTGDPNATSNAPTPTGFVSIWIQ